jgi:hypothetical protein
MVEPPGTDTAAHLAFAIVDELIGTLVSKGHLKPADRLAIYGRVAETLEKSTRSKPAAEFIRQLVILDK